MYLRTIEWNYVANQFTLMSNKCWQEIHMELKASTRLCAIRERDVILHDEAAVKATVDNEDSGCNSRAPTSQMKLSPKF